MAFLADSNTLTKSDYLVHIENMFEVINKVPVTITSFTKLKPIAVHLTQDEEVIALIKNRLAQSDRRLNLQNLQMYQTLLDELENNNKDCLGDLQDYQQKLRELKSGILNLRNDSVLSIIARTDSLRIMFSDQFKELNEKRFITDSLIKGNTLLLNNLQARTSANLIGIKELIYDTDNELKSVSINAFGKERRYLWEPSASKQGNRNLNFKKFINSEQQISRYYFIYTKSSRLLLMLTGAIFFFWVFFNFRSVKQRKKLDALNDFNFSLIVPQPYLITLILILTLAPIFDLGAPALYIEVIHLLLSICLSVLFYRKVPRKIFYRWLIFILFLLAPSFLRALGMPPGFQRWLLFALSISSMAFGLLTLKAFTDEAKKYTIISGVAIMFIFFSFFAALCNLFGRFTLTQVFYTTGTSALMYAVSFIILVKIINEAFLLQMTSSRIRKNNPHYFDWKPIISGGKRILGVGAFLMWFILFTTNLNVFNGLYTEVMEVLTEKRTIGSFSFTFSGIVLFAGIIWTANFLQKYIAYFLGDTGEELLDENVGERSKLLVTRLVLLIGGFLIAVAASGLPIDKITVILGALGVGIGLGLQNIVSNFVSGIILIFDKTIRIGDVVELANKKGRVKEIGVRASTLLSDEGAEIIIPNGTILSNNIINWTLSNNYMRVDIELSVSKPFNTTDIITLIKETIHSNTNVYLHKEPKIMISPINATNSSIKVYFWCKDISESESTKNVIHAQIFEELEKQGIVCI